MSVLDSIHICYVERARVCVVCVCVCGCVCARACVGVCLRFPCVDGVLRFWIFAVHKRLVFALATHVRLRRIMLTRMYNKTKVSP